MTGCFKLLLADDNKDDCLLIKRSLRLCPALHLTGEVDDGRMLQGYLAGGGVYQDRHAYPIPDVLFLDPCLALGEGREALEWCHAQPWPNLKIILVTGSPRSEICRELLGLGAHGVLAKCGNLKQLDAAMQEVEANLVNGTYGRR